MPERPPKEWFDDCVQGVKESSPEVDDPNAVCGDLWYNKMSASARRKAMQREQNMVPVLTPNPIGGGGLLIGLLVGGGIAYWYFTKDKDDKDKDEKSEGTKPSETACVIDPSRLNDWALSKDPPLPIVYLYAVNEAPSIDMLKAQWSTTFEPSVFELPYTIVVITKDGKFYKYNDQGEPVLAPELRTDFCQAYGG